MLEWPFGESRCINVCVHCSGGLTLQSQWRNRFEVRIVFWPLFFFSFILSLLHQDFHSHAQWLMIAPVTFLQISSFRSLIANAMHLISFIQILLLVCSDLVVWPFLFCTSYSVSIPQQFILYPDTFKVWWSLIQWLLSSIPGQIYGQIFLLTDLNLHLYQWWNIGNAKNAAPFPPSGLEPTLSSRFSLAIIHNSYGHLIVGSNKICHMSTPTSEMESVALPRWAEATKVKMITSGRIRNQRPIPRMLFSFSSITPDSANPLIQTSPKK